MYRNPILIMFHQDPGIGHQMDCITKDYYVHAWPVMGKIINYLDDSFPLVTLVLPIWGTLFCHFFKLVRYKWGKKTKIKVV